MRLTRIGVWAAAAAVAVAVTTTAVAAATGVGRDVLTEEGVADALAAANAPEAAGPRSAPIGAPVAAAVSGHDARADGEEKLLQTIGGDIVASCDDGVMTLHSIAPKPGYQIMMMTIDQRSLALRKAKWFAMPPTPRQAHPIRVTVSKGGGLSLVFDKASSEVSNKVALSCVDGEPMAKESEMVKNYGAGKG